MEINESYERIMGRLKYARDDIKKYNFTSDEKKELVELINKISNIIWEK